MKKSDEIRIFANVLGSVLNHIEWQVEYYETNKLAEQRDTIEVELDEHTLSLYNQMYEHVSQFKG